MIHKAWSSIEEMPYCFWGSSENFSVTRLTQLSILTRIERFRTVTTIRIHQWVWNDAQSLKWHRRGALLFFKVIHQISRSHGSKNRRIWPKLGVSRLQFEFTNRYEIIHKAWSRIEEMPFCFWGSSVKFLGHTAKKNRRFWPEFSVSGL